MKSTLIDIAIAFVVIIIICSVSLIFEDYTAVERVVSALMLSVAVVLFLKIPGKTL